MSKMIGIDLGTTNSVVAVSQAGQPEVICDEHGVALLPSVVAYADDGSAVVGAAASALLQDQPERVVSSIKRLMGRGLGDLNAVAGTLPFEVADSDEAVMQRYVDERGRRLTEPVTAALRAAGLDSTTVFREGADPALAISQLAEEVNADVVLLGATRQIFDQSAWESVSARVMIESGRPVLVLPPGLQDVLEPDVTEEI